MQLREIESIVRANFVFDKTGDHKEHMQIPAHWRVNEKTNGNNDMAALIVFTGVCWMLGFPDEKVFEYVDIKRPRHTALLGRFKQALSHHQAAQTHELFEDQSDINKLIIKKANIVMNGIKAKQPASYISLADFDF